MTDGDVLRIGTAERENAVRLLGDHMSEGRLSLEEYEERTAGALAAVTRADLRPLFKDLPPPYPAFMNPPAPRPTTIAYAHLPPPVGYSHAPPPVPTDSYRYRVVAGALQIVLPFGIGRFYTGHTHMGVAQLLTSFIGIGVIWSIIDGILILLNGGDDADGRELRT